jgi:predicted RNase H-like HicB family nuclease
MKSYHINIFYSEEDQGYIADIPDLKYCSAFGDTEEEALQEVLKAKAAWLEIAEAEQRPIPEQNIALPFIKSLDSKPESL